MASKPRVAAELSLHDAATQKIADFNKQLAGMTAPLNAATQSLKAFGREIGMSRLGAALDGVKSKLSGVGGAFKSLAKDAAYVAGGITAAGAGLFAITKQAADVGDALATNAAKIGVTTQAWSELTFAGEKLDVAAGDLESSLTRLNKNIIDAAHGNKQLAEAFEYTGVELQDAEGNFKAADAVMMELSDVFAKMEDGPKKAALAMALFGRSGANMLPMLNAGSAAIRQQREEAQKLGVVWTDQAGSDANDFNNHLIDLQKSFQGVSNAIAQKLFPVFNPLIVQVKDIVVQFREWLSNSDNVTQAVEWLKDKTNEFLGALPGLWKQIQDGIRKVDEFVQSIGGWSSALKIAGAVIVGIKLAPLVMAITQLTGAFLNLGWTAAGVAVRIVKAFQSGAVTQLVQGMASGISASFTAVATAAKAALMPAISAVSTAFSALWAVIVANPIGALIAAVAALGAAVYLIYENWDAIGPYFEKLWNGIKEIFGAYIDGIVALFTGDWGGVYDAGAKIIGVFWDGMKAVWAKLDEWLGGSLGWVADKIGGVADTIGGWFGFGPSEQPQQTAPRAHVQTTGYDSLADAPADIVDAVRPTARAVQTSDMASAAPVERSTQVAQTDRQRDPLKIIIENGTNSRVEAPNAAGAGYDVEVFNDPYAGMSTIVGR